MQEHGVKQALENRSLSKLQLSFHANDENPPSTENLFEAYALNFAYKNGLSITEITTKGMKNSNIGNKSFTIGEAMGQLDYLLKTMDYIISEYHRVNLSDLPGEYFPRSHLACRPNPRRKDSFRMLLSLKYIGTDKEHPVGFHAGNRDHEALVEVTHLSPKLKVDTGHHRHEYRYTRE